MLIYIITDGEFIYKLDRVQEEMRWIYLGRNSDRYLVQIIERKSQLVPAKVSDLEIMMRDRKTVSRNRWEEDEAIYYTYPYVEGDV